MEILQLRYFYESAISESFTETARKFMVPTSSVSASVRLLEKELGCKLFDRAYNRIILNSKGKRLQQALFSVFSELEQAIKDLSCDKDSYRFKTARNFCLGTSDGWAFSRKVWSDLADIEESKIKEKAKILINEEQYAR